jgi:hypothetical protein
MGVTSGPLSRLCGMLAPAGEPLLLLENLDRNSRPVVRRPSLVGIDDTQWAGSVTRIGHSRSCGCAPAGTPTTG